MGPESNVASGFFRSALRLPRRPALEGAGWTVRYEELGGLAQDIAATLRALPDAGQPFIGLLAERSLAAYAGLLGILASGRGYVPLHPRFPIERTRSMWRTSGARTLLLGNEALPLLDELLAGAEAGMSILLPETPDVSILARRHEGHHFIGSGQLSRGHLSDPVRAVQPDDLAWLVFTSGTTGVPKGVAASHGNACAYVRYMASFLSVRETDRASHLFELTYDSSVHDLLTTWEGGGCVCPAPPEARIAPGSYLRDSALTLWFSVPTVAMFLHRLGRLVPGAFPRLRFSLFGGEPLPLRTVSAWRRAAQHSRIANLYGPTEATVFIAHHLLPETPAPDAEQEGTAPLGALFPRHRARLVDEQLADTPEGEPGELCVTGPQVTSGYFHDPARTAKHFVHLQGSHEVWYRTGDRVRQDPDGCLYFLGRLDHQIKLRGHRIELEEIDGVLRRASGTDLAVTLPWPVVDGAPQGLVGLVSLPADAFDEQALLLACREKLPGPMVPARIHCVASLPINVNGKIDRDRLYTYLEGLRRP